MKINKLQTLDFMGLPGKRAWTFDKVTAFCGPNGTGKTSVINALRYALTGDEPDGDLIYTGRPSSAVQIDTPKGSTFCRIKKRGKQSCYSLNGKRTSLGELTRVLEAEMGDVPVKNARLITSNELLTELGDKTFGDLLISYLPEMLDKETVMRSISNPTQGMKKIVAELLPDGEFDAKEIDHFFSLVTEKRRDLKRRISENITLLGAYEPRTINASKEELQERITKLQKERDEAAMYSAKVEEYNRLLKLKKEQEQMIVSIGKQIIEINAVRHPVEERNAVADLLSTSRKAGTAAYGAMKAAIENGNALKKAIQTIAQPVCPLSESIHCTTDKRPVLNELKKNLQTVAVSYHDQEKAFKEAKETACKAEKDLQKIDSDNAQADRKDALIRQREEMSRTLPELPEKPGEAPNAVLIGIEYDQAQQSLMAIQEKEKADVLRKTIEEQKLLLADYEALHTAFSPKGEVKRAVTEFYLEEFQKPCNEYAGKLFPGMKIRFLAENGVTILVDPKGLDQYNTFDSLSGGERAAVTFLLMLMLAKLSGLRIIILDELSVLDKRAFESLLEILDDCKDEYDMAVIGCVDHADTVQALENRRIRIEKI